MRKWKVVSRSTALSGLIGLSLGLSQGASAQVSDTYQIDLILTSSDDAPVYRVNDSPLWLQLPDKGSPPLTVSLRSGARGYVRVLDYNPAFYVYKATSGSTQIADVAAIQKLASALTTAFGATGSLVSSGINGASQAPANAATAAAPAAPAAPANVCTALMNGIPLQGTLDLADAVRKYLTDTLPNAILHPLVSPPAGPPRESQLRIAAQAAQVALTQMPDFTRLGNALTAFDRSQVTLTCAEDHDDSRTVRSGQGISGLIKVLASPDSRDHYLNFDDIEQQLATLAVVLGATSNYAQVLAQIASDLKSLDSDLNQVGTPFGITTDVAFDPTNISTRSVALTWNTRYDTLFTASGDEKDRTLAQQRASKFTKYEVDFPPHESYHFGLSVATVYSFVKNPAFSAQTTNGQLTIAQTSSDYNKVTAAVAVNMTPDAVFNQFGQPHLEFGVVPDSSKFGLFAGVGLTFLAPKSTSTTNAAAVGGKTSSSSSSTSLFQGLELNVGVIYQKVNELAPGLAVGQGIANTQALKTNTVFKTGLYVGLGVKLK